MSETKKNVKPEYKEFSVSKEDRELLESQRSVRTHYLYLAELIERDMRLFVEIQLRKKLNISEDMNIAYDSKTGKVYARPKQKTQETSKAAEKKSN
jgi:hypothetical protein